MAMIGGLLGTTFKIWLQTLVSKMALKRTTLDWAVEGFSLAILLSIFINLTAHWSVLPERIPTHFGASGTPNGWGSKNVSWLLPGVALALYLLLTAASRYQRLINLPVRVDRELPEVKRLLLTMSIWMKAIVMVVFAYISWAEINTALGKAQGLGPMFLPLFLAATFAPVIFFTRKLRQYRL